MATAPTSAARYWGLGQQEYYTKADVWPLSPEGEIFCILMIEDTVGIKNLDDILKQRARHQRHPHRRRRPLARSSASRASTTTRRCASTWRGSSPPARQHNVVVGHPHVDADNVERVLAEGYRFLMAAPGRSYAGLNKGRELAGRA